MAQAEDKGMEALQNGLKLAEALPHRELALTFVTMAAYFSARAPQLYAEYSDMMESLLEERTVKAPDYQDVVDKTRESYKGK